LPAQTFQAEDHVDSLGWTPRPTKAPSAEFLFKRQGVASGSVCGYVTYDAHDAVYCYESQLCATNGNMWECCSTSQYIVSNYVTLTQGSNCTILNPATCYNYNATSQCTGTCLSTATVCTNSNYPACATVTSAYANVTAVFCDTSSWASPVYSDYLAPSVTSSSLASNTYAPTGATGPTVPYSRSQQTLASSAGGTQSAGSSKPSSSGVRRVFVGYSLWWMTGLLYCVGMIA